MRREYILSFEEVEVLRRIILIATREDERDFNAGRTTEKLGRLFNPSDLVKAHEILK